jgi:BMFP domain-containing protein YqiC
MHQGEFSYVYLKTLHYTPCVNLPSKCANTFFQRALRYDYVITKIIYNPLYCEQEAIMNQFFTDFQAKVNQALENSPAKDLEKNVKAMMTQGFAKLDLVTREEFDIQAQVLAKTRAKLEALEARVTELEAGLKRD